MSHRIETIVTALRNLGGQARPAQIASEIRRVFPGPHPRTLLNSVRGRLQECSSDSKLFRNKRDLFYSVHGIGGGVWGLREINPSGDGDTATNDGGREQDEPDFNNVISRLRGGAQPIYGTPLEGRRRQELLDDIARLQEELARLKPQHGGIGHNQPPQTQSEMEANSEMIAAVSHEAAAIQAEVTKKSPDALAVAHSAQWLRRCGHWLAGKADTLADEFAKAFGKALGMTAGTVLPMGALIIALNSTIRSAAHWLLSVLPVF